jgi:hypothetical protein
LEEAALQLVHFFEFRIMPKDRFGRRKEKFKLRHYRKAPAKAIGITVDERTRPATLEAVWRAFGGYILVYRDEFPKYRLPATLIRQSAYLTHPVFHMNRAESEMTRYMRRLADRDLALDRAMIPLGSCTMKLNATAEMLPITWPEFAEMLRSSDNVAKIIDTCAEEADRSNASAVVHKSRSEAEGALFRQLIDSTEMEKR